MFYRKRLKEIDERIKKNEETLKSMADHLSRIAEEIRRVNSIVSGDYGYNNGLARRLGTAEDNLSLLVNYLGVKRVDDPPKSYYQKDEAKP